MLKYASQLVVTNFKYSNYLVLDPASIILLLFICIIMNSKKYKFIISLKNYLVTII
jgi:hypothetical protein